MNHVLCPCIKIIKKFRWTWCVLVTAIFPNPCGARYEKPSHPCVLFKTVSGVKMNCATYSSQLYDWSSRDWNLNVSTGILIYSHSRPYEHQVLSLNCQHFLLGWASKHQDNHWQDHCPQSFSEFVDLSLTIHMQETLILDEPQVMLFIYTLSGVTRYAVM